MQFGQGIVAAVGLGTIFKRPNILEIVDNGVIVFRVICLKVSECFGVKFNFDLLVS